jgi:signal transduction histidine kinase
VNAVVEHAISVLRAELDRNIVQLELKLNKHLSDIRGDSVLIEQVIVNLIQNSIQALNDNLNAKKIIVVSTHESDESVFITIADNGPGIPSEKSDEIFNPFFSTKPDGLGLGLNICRTIVEAHRGHISVTTQGILGAIFTINLPVEK